MKNSKKFTYAIVSAILLQMILLSSVPLVKADTSIPDNFNKNLDLDQVYIYNVSAYNTTKPLEWKDFFWSTVAYANTTPGGQLKINFTGFYEKNPNDMFNLFESPMPYMNIEFIENRSGIHVTNTTLLNVSNGAAAMNLLLGYNAFQSGFLIPNTNFNNLTQQATAQDVPPFWNATVTIQLTSKTISFDFKQKSSTPQETKCIYDKVSGLLVYTNTSFGNYTLEMTLTNIPNLPTGEISIPSFQPYILIGSIIIISIIYVTNLRKKK